MKENLKKVVTNPFVVVIGLLLIVGFVLAPIYQRWSGPTSISPPAAVADGKSVVKPVTPTSADQAIGGGLAGVLEILFKAVGLEQQDIDNTKADVKKQGDLLADHGTRIKKVEDGLSAVQAPATADGIRKVIDDELKKRGITVSPPAASKPMSELSPPASLPKKEDTASADIPPAGATPPATAGASFMMGGSSFSSCKDAQQFMYRKDGTINPEYTEHCGAYDQTVQTASLDFNTQCTSNGGKPYTAEEWNKKGAAPHLNPGQQHCVW